MTQQRIAEDINFGYCCSERCVGSVNNAHPCKFGTTAQISESFWNQCVQLATRKSTARTTSKKDANRAHRALNATPLC